LAAAETALGSAISAEAKEQAERVKAQAVAGIAELQVQLASAKAELQPKLDAVTPAREAAAVAETARVAAAEAARQVAREIASNAPLAVQAAKRMMRMGLNETFPDHVHHVYLQLLPLFKTQDMQEGIKAFMEKREPKFEGR